MLNSFPKGGLAIVVGASGGIGEAVTAHVKNCGRFAQVIGTSRNGSDAVDLTDEPSLAALAKRSEATGLDVRLVFDATGILHDGEMQPEKTFSAIDPDNMAHQFAINTIGPALLMKHLLPLLPRDGKSVFATISAKVGSIGDNAIGGWYSYRASKAALNQLVHTAAIELARKRKEAVCIALHPGTVETQLSQPFARAGLRIQSPDDSAGSMLGVIDNLTADDSGGFFAYSGEALPW